MAKKRKRQISNINSELPSSIIEVIFSKLPLFNLPSCRIVCKKWNDLILTCKFDSQISISSLFFKHRWLPFDRKSGNLVCVEFDPNPLKGMSTVVSFHFHPKLSNFSIVNSCNGILCLLIKKYCASYPNRRPHAVCILNPMTNEYLKLPISKADRSKDYNYGLGFSPKTKQYKIARASIPFDMYGTLIEIVAFGTSSEWITVGFLPSFFNSIDFVYSNGGLYLVKDYTDRVIFRLDVEDERIEEVSSPTDRGMFHHMVDLDGTLYVTFFSYDHVHVWKMREDSSWIQIFVFSIPSPTSFEFKFFKVYEDGKILCKYDYDLILYDPMSDTKEVLADQYAKIMGMKSFHQIGSSNFNSLLKILAGNG